MQNKSSQSNPQADLLRLNKALAAAGICSRRKADEYIFAKKVEVNGEIVDEPGRRIDPASDTVLFEGKKIYPRSSKDADNFIYLLLNKPIETVTTMRDPQKRTTVIDLLPPKLRKTRVYPVGRLDYFSEGLLLLTNDGELANILAHPSSHLPKVYEVTVRGKVTKDMIRTMTKGMTLDEGERLAPVRVDIKQSANNQTRMHLTLMQGLNRQIRRMMRDLNLTILKLKRISQGPLNLGNLPPGKTRVLSPSEVKSLKNALKKKHKK